MKKTKGTNELIKMLNHALELENAAHLQYSSHAELISGLYAEPIIARLREIADDEVKHQKKIRSLIADYLGGVPSMGIAETHSGEGKTVEQILEIAIKGEKEGVDFYTQIVEKVKLHKADLTYAFWTLEHEIRHFIMDEEEHIAELNVLLSQR